MLIKIALAGERDRKLSYIQNYLNAQGFAKLEQEFKKTEPKVCNDQIKYNDFMLKFNRDKFIKSEGALSWFENMEPVSKSDMRMMSSFIALKTNILSGLIESYEARVRDAKKLLAELRLTPSLKNKIEALLKLIETKFPYELFAQTTNGLRNRSCENYDYFVLSIFDDLNSYVTNLKDSNKICTSTDIEGSDVVDEVDGPIVFLPWYKNVYQSLSSADQTALLASLQMALEGNLKEFGSMSRSADVEKALKTEDGAYLSFPSLYLTIKFMYFIQGIIHSRAKELSEKGETLYFNRCG